jgi:uncharacterized small protein (DUF1192 family)
MGNQKGMADQIDALKAELAAANADKLALEELFIVNDAVDPAYECGWNAAISKTIERFGRNALFQENEELVGDVIKLEAELAAANAEIRRLKNAVRQYLSSHEDLSKGCTFVEDIPELCRTHNYNKPCPVGIILEALAGKEDNDG